MQPILRELSPISNSLTHLLLQDNALQGNLPSEELGLLVNLVQLKLDDNKLSGSIPSSVGVCFRMRAMRCRPFVHATTEKPVTCVPSAIDGAAIPGLERQSIFRHVLRQFVLHVWYLLSKLTVESAGPIPLEALSLLCNLKELKLQNNKLEGTQKVVYPCRISSLARNVLKYSILSARCRRRAF